jgi:hypothetical protein
MFSISVSDFDKTSYETLMEKEGKGKEEQQDKVNIESVRWTKNNCIEFIFVIKWQDNE